ncbi:MAG: HD domain-containing protein [Chitinophagales bacterium]|nr:HD domain-containing protein [Chitinophagales bacterium]
MIDLKKIETFIIEKLRRGLDPRLTYHGVHHTIDVVKEAMQIASEEHVTDPEDLLILHIAALFHDTGFLFIYKDHEERSCLIAKEFLPAFGVSSDQLNRIYGMIAATKLPQSPKNHLEQIICDADLDYLGREDFFATGKALYLEWKSYRFVKDEDDWNVKQVRFLEGHHYYTKSSALRREALKAQHLTELKKAVIP